MVDATLPSLTRSQAKVVGANYFYGQKLSKLSVKKSFYSQRGTPVSTGVSVLDNNLDGGYPVGVSQIRGRPGSDLATLATRAAKKALDAGQKVLLLFPHNNTGLNLRHPNLRVVVPGCLEHALGEVRACQDFDLVLIVNVEAFASSSTHSQQLWALNLPEIRSRAMGHNIAVVGLSQAGNRDLQYNGAATGSLPWLRTSDLILHLETRNEEELVKVTVLKDRSKTQHSHFQLSFTEFFAEKGRTEVSAETLKCSSERPSLRDAALGGILSALLGKVHPFLPTATASGRDLVIAESVEKALEKVRK